MPASNSSAYIPNFRCHWVLGSAGTAFVMLKSGDILLATLSAGDDDKWRFNVSWRKEPIVLNESWVVSAAMLGKKVFLSDVKPARIEETPFIDLIHHPRWDRGLDGSRISLGPLRAVKGIFMHSRTRVGFKIAAQKHLKFCAIAGIDRRFAVGDADLVISADGKELRRQPIKARNAPAVVLVEIPPGAKSLEIMTDYGHLGSAGDHVNILWAAVVVRK